MIFFRNFNLGWVLVVNNLHESQDILSLICRPMRPSNYYFKSPLRLFQCSFFFSSFSNMKIALPALICPAWEAKSKVIHSKYYKHLAYDLAHKKIIPYALAYFDPSEYILRPKLTVFSTFCYVINF